MTWGRAIKEDEIVEYRRQLRKYERHELWSTIVKWVLGLTACCGALAAGFPDTKWLSAVGAAAGGALAFLNPADGSRRASGAAAHLRFAVVNFGSDPTWTVHQVGLQAKEAEQIRLGSTDAADKSASIK
jgi:hypothetical protein